MKGRISPHLARFDDSHISSAELRRELVGYGRAGRAAAQHQQLVRVLAPRAAGRRELPARKRRLRRRRQRRDDAVVRAGVATTDESYCCHFPRQGHVVDCR